MAKKWTRKSGYSSEFVYVGGPIRGISFEVVKFITEDGKKCVQCWKDGGCLFEQIDNEYYDYTSFEILETVVDCRAGLKAAGMWDSKWDRFFL